MDEFTDSAVKAVSEGKLDILETIADELPQDRISKVLSQQGKYGWTPLNAAINRGDVLSVRFLLNECHVDPMVRNKNSSLYPLAWAADKGELQIVILLTTSGAKLNLFDEEDYISPLSKACIEGHLDIAFYLIEKGEDIGRTNSLMNAMRSGSMELAKYIMRCGANTNVQDRDGLTPLHACCQWGDLEIVEMLIDQRADHRAIYKGLNPIQWAAWHGNENIIEFYSYLDFYTHAELLECFLFLGMEAVERQDLPAVEWYWRRVLKGGPINVKGQYNIKNNIDSDFLIKDIEIVAIHSIQIMKKLFGIDDLLLKNYILSLLYLIPITYIEVWDLILELSADISEHDIANICSVFMSKFELYMNVPNKMYLSFNNEAFDFSHSIFVIRDRHIKNIRLCYWTRCFVNVCSVKERLSDAEMQFLHMILKKCLIQKPLKTETILHLFFYYSNTPVLPGRLRYETLEMLCQISDSVNYLDYINQTPLHLVLKRYFDREYVDILLKYGAVNFSRNKYGQSIRDLARRISGIEPYKPSFQTLIAAKLRESSVDQFKGLTSILKYFTKFH